MIAPEIRKEIADELMAHFNGKLDGSRRNILVSVCPFCGHSGYKYGIYVGEDIGRKKFGSSNCFYCNRKFRTLEKTLSAIGRLDLMPKETVELDNDVEDLTFDFEEEIDDDLVEIEMPKGYKRCKNNTYLKSRGWNTDDYIYFPVGTNRGVEYKYDGYVLLEVIDSGRTVGFVGRSVLSKEEIERRNLRRSRPIMRYKNSFEEDGNGFSKMLYNYDSVIPMETVSVILCEGPFDVVGLNRKLELYDNHLIVPVATFGKKISDEQIYKLQKKGVEQVVIGYDNDAKETTAKIAVELDKYFDVLVADIPDGIGKDWDEMDVADIYDVFANNLKTVTEFNLE